MSANDEIDVFALGARKLDPGEYFEWQRNAMKRAHRLRSGHALASLLGLATAVVNAARCARTMLNRVREARVDRLAIARLHALDDGALKDIGIRRSEIESVVHGHGADETRLRRDQRLAA